MKSVVIVLLSWNKKLAVIECIDRVTRLQGADVHVVVVDNASADDSVAAIRIACPAATILCAPTNLGFAGGVNRGLEEAGRRNADYALLLNDDTTFDDTVLIRLLAGAALLPAGGLLSPLLHDLGPAGGIQFENGIVDWRRGAMGHNFPDGVFRARVIEGATPILPGTVLLCDLRVYRTIGPFDERFFAYWEDTDYSVRAARAGFTNVVVRTSQVAHAAPPATQRPPYYHYYMTRNEALFWRTHAAGDVRWRRRWLSRALDAIGRERDLGHVDNARAIADGLWHAGTRRYGSQASHPQAPRAFARLLMAAPYLWGSVVRGELGAVLARLFRRK